MPGNPYLFRRYYHFNRCLLAEAGMHPAYRREASGESIDEFLFNVFVGHIPLPAVRVAGEWIGYTMDTLQAHGLHPCHVHVLDENFRGQVRAFFRLGNNFERVGIAEECAGAHHAPGNNRISAPEINTSGAISNSLFLQAWMSVAVKNLERLV